MSLVSPQRFVPTLSFPPSPKFPGQAQNWSKCDKWMKKYGLSHAMDTWAAELAGDVATDQARKESEATSFASLEAGCTSNTTRLFSSRNTRTPGADVTDVPLSVTAPPFAGT